MDFQYSTRIIYIKKFIHDKYIINIYLASEYNYVRLTDKEKVVAH